MESKRQNIDELTIGEAKRRIAEADELRQQLGWTAPTPTAVGQSHSFTVGDAIFVRTVTYHYTGKLVAVTDADIVLDEAAWIAEDGRFSQALATGELNEIEPYPGRCVVSRGAIIDWCNWTHALPRTVK
jgi:hypothetical protein